MREIVFDTETTGLDPKTGDLYISDGYANARVHKYSEDGKPLLSWGESGTGEGQFNIVHNIDTDNDGWGYVADRENRRIKIFSEGGRLLETYNTPGYPYAVKPLGQGYFVSVEGRDASDREGAIVRVWRPDGTIGRILDASGEGPTKGHDLAIGGDGTIYLADPEGKRVLTFELAQTTEDE